MSKAVSPDEVYQEVVSGAKYRNLYPVFVRRVCRQESLKGRSLKETVKAVRSKLHQAGAAYQEQGIPYDLLGKYLTEMGDRPAPEQWKDLARAALPHHASTAERLPILEGFFTRTLADIAPVHSVLDLACGLNPLAFPFMPLAEGATYRAGDIYLDLVEFLNLTFEKAPFDCHAFPLDLAAEIPSEPVQVAFLLKTLPCMEQQVKDHGKKLLTGLNADHLLISFPVHSLGGRSKGMAAHYDAYLQEITAGQNWLVKRYDFPVETAYLISK